MSEQRRGRSLVIELRYPDTGLSVPLALTPTLDSSGSPQAFLRALSETLGTLAAEYGKGAAAMESGAPSDM